MSEQIHYEEIGESIEPLISISECILIWISLRENPQMQYDEKEAKIYKAMTDRILEASMIHGGFICNSNDQTP